MSSWHTQATRPAYGLKVVIEHPFLGRRVAVLKVANSRDMWEIEGYGLEETWRVNLWHQYDEGLLSLAADELSDPTAVQLALGI